MHTDISPSTRRKYEKLAGYMFLFIIITFISGTVAISMITGSGDFAQKAQNIAAGETAYRLVFTGQIFGYIFTMLLSFSLYAILRYHNPLMAKLALYFRLVEVAISCVVLSYRLVQMDLYANKAYIGPFALEQVQMLHRHATAFYDSGFNISGIFFAFGSTLFFYLLYTSRYMPRWIGMFGIFGSIVAGMACIGSLVLPQYSVIELGWLPSLLQEIFAGIWLIFIGNKTLVASKSQAG